MKRPLLLAIVFLCPLFSTQASTEAVSTEVTSTESAGNPVYANILKGDLKVDGSASFSYGEVTGTEMRLSPRLEYFVLDHFSVGGGLDFVHAPGYRATTWSFGPTATYYFWSHERFAAFFNQGVSVSHSSVGTEPTITYFSTTSQLGLDYFIIPAVAFGPAAQWTHTFSNSDIDSQDTLSFVGKFAIHF